MWGEHRRRINPQSKEGKKVPVAPRGKRAKPGDERGGGASCFEVVKGEKHEVIFKP